MKIKEFAFVAYPLTDIARARKFYEGALGLTPSLGERQREKLAGAGGRHHGRFHGDGGWRLFRDGGNGFRHRPPEERH